MVSDRVNITMVVLQVTSKMGWFSVMTVILAKWKL